MIGFQLSTPIVLARRDHRRQKRRARATAEENPIILAIPPPPVLLPLLLLFPGEIGLLTLSDRRGEKVVCHPARSLRHALCSLAPPPHSCGKQPDAVSSGEFLEMRRAYRYDFLARIASLLFLFGQKKSPLWRPLTKLIHPRKTPVVDWSRHQSIVRPSAVRSGHIAFAPSV